MVQTTQCCLVGGGAKWTIPRGMVERESVYVPGHFYDSMGRSNHILKDKKHE